MVPKHPFPVIRPQFIIIPTLEIAGNWGQGVWVTFPKSYSRISALRLPCPFCYVRWPLQLPSAPYLPSQIDLVHILQALCSLTEGVTCPLDVPISVFPQSLLHNCVKAHRTFSLKCVFIWLSLRLDRILCGSNIVFLAYYPQCQL